LELVIIDLRLFPIFHFLYLGWGMIPDFDSQIMVDNHDNQRGHGLIFKDFFF
jgi:hypothetical protein